MHGTGNSFIIIADNENISENYYKLSQKLCDYNFGVGADGLLVIHTKNTAPN